MSTETLSKPEVIASSILRRSARLNSGFFSGFRRMATTSSSKILLPRSIRSRCPLVGGSNDPGYMALMRFTEASVDDRVNERRIVCGRWRRWQFEGLKAFVSFVVQAFHRNHEGHEGPRRKTKSLSLCRKRLGHGLLEENYPLAGTLPASAADGIVVTRPCVPVACAGTAAGAAGTAAGIIPNAFRTSASSLAIVSLFSFRKLRGFSRPCPMRSPL